jgi:hypothetical protein
VPGRAISIINDLWTRGKIEECIKIMGEKEGLEKGKNIYYRAEHQDYMRNQRGVSKQDLQELVLKMKDLIMSSTEKNPVQMFFDIVGQLEKWKTGLSVPVHGEWHHFLVPGVLLCALRNNGYEINDKDIDEGIQRGEQARVSCGFTGVCGGANSVGIVAAVVKKVTPLHDEGRQELMQKTARVLQKISQVKRRCCKRSSYIALEEAIQYFAGIDYILPSLNITCPFSPQNSMCAKKRCPYFEAE